MGWKNTKVRHVDGRSGVISDEVEGSLHLGLTIAVADGAQAHVQLNANGKDSGATGWAWFCPEFSPGPAWLPLGDHHNTPVCPADPQQA